MTTRNIYKMKLYEKYISYTIPFSNGLQLHQQYSYSGDVVKIEIYSNAELVMIIDRIHRTVFYNKNADIKCRKEMIKALYIRNFEPRWLLLGLDSLEELHNSVYKLQLATYENGVTFGYDLPKVAINSITKTNYIFLRRLLK